jgi:putative hydrolase of the HAD superfamily
MIDAARRVRSAGYRTAILTNNIREWGAWRTLWEADELVDVVIDSCEVGLRKPNAEIYELTLGQLGSVAGRTLFLDDFPWNIAGAETVGLQTMHVTDPVTAAAELLDRLL